VCQFGAGAASKQTHTSARERANARTRERANARTRERANARTRERANARPLLANRARKKTRARANAPRRLSPHAAAAAALTFVQNKIGSFVGSPWLSAIQWNV